MTVKKITTHQPECDDECASLPPLTNAIRTVGGDATAEIAELCGVMLEHGDDLSGFARRGLVVRMQQLAHEAQTLFYGGHDDGYDTYEGLQLVYGMGNPDVARASAAIRAEKDVRHA